MKMTVAVAFAILLSVLCRADSLLVHSGTIIPLDPDLPESFVGYLLIESDGKVALVGEGSPPAEIQADRSLDATGKIIIPGFVSAHSHLRQSPFRGLARNGQLWDWLAAVIFEFAPHFEEGDLYAFSKHGAFDYLRNGITTVYNHAHNMNYDEAHNREQFEASLDVNQRIIFGYGLAPADALEVRLEKIEAYVADYSALAGSDDRVLRMGLYGHESYHPEECHREEAKLVNKYGLVNQIHCLESPNRLHSRFDIPKLLAAGKFSRHLSLAHFVHATPEIVEVAVEHDVSMVWNPLSNGRLGSGFADVPKYRKSGLRVGMGIDSQSCTDVTDPFQNMRMGLYATRMVYASSEVMDPIDVLRYHTLGAADVLGVVDAVGSLSAGKFGDFVVLNPGAPETAPVFDPVATVVFGLSSPNIEAVYTGGQLAVEKGRVIGANADALNSDVHERVARIRAAAARVERPDNFNDI